MTNAALPDQGHATLELDGSNLVWVEDPEAWDMISPGILIVLEDDSHGVVVEKSPDRRRLLVYKTTSNRPQEILAAYRAMKSHSRRDRTTLIMRFQKSVFDTEEPERRVIALEALLYGFHKLGRGFSYDELMLFFDMCGWTPDEILHEFGFMQDLDWARFPRTAAFRQDLTTHTRDAEQREVFFSAESEPRRPGETPLGRRRVRIRPVVRSAGDPS